MKTTIKRILSLLLALCCICALAAPALAANVAEATIDTSKKGSLTIYKYDLTNAEKDGVWDSSYVSTGVYDQTGVNDILGGTVRAGDTDNNSVLGNGETSYGYAIKGVEFTYLRVADIAQFTESTADGRTDDHVEVLYGIDKIKGADFLAAIGLANGASHYVNADATDKLDSNKYYYQSDVLINALQAALEANSTTVKNALETYVKGNGGTAMAQTDAYGKTGAANLDLGLYLVVETKVPEMVVSTTNPFLVSLPMTSVNGNNATDGGTRWIYDVTLYPKNLTGIPSLEKTLREQVSDTGKNGGSTTDITDGYAHTATASDGDVIDYQIISTLPSITSAATYLTCYTFVDTLAKGLTYNKNDVVLEFFTDASCTQKITTWNQREDTVTNPAPFVVSYSTTAGGDSVMTIKITDAGLNEINTANNVYTVASMVNSGYSDCTLRITYQATVNSNNSVVYGDDGNANEVVLTWKRSSSTYYDTLVDDAHIYTYGIDLTKTFSDGQGDFTNVEFIIHNDTDNYYIQAVLNQAEGIYYVVDNADAANHACAEADATHFIPVTSGSVDGKVIVKGLEDDTYTITEVRTDNGYTLLAKDIKVVISQTETTDLCDIYKSDVVGLIQNDPRFAEAIINEAVTQGYIKTNGGLADILNNMPQKYLEHHLLTASATVDGNNVTMLSDNGSVNAEAPLNVVNTHGFNLPQTGELLAVLLPIVGGIFIGVAVMVICFLPKRKDDKTIQQ